MLNVYGWTLIGRIPAVGTLISGCILPFGLLICGCGWFVPVGIRFVGQNLAIWPILVHLKHGPLSLPLASPLVGQSRAICPTPAHL